jgi:hypothetical protein
MASTTSCKEGGLHLLPLLLLSPPFNGSKLLPLVLPPLLLLPVLLLLASLLLPASELLPSSAAGATMLCLHLGYQLLHGLLLFMSDALTTEHLVKVLSEAL